MAAGMQALTSRCRAMLAATVRLGAWEAEGEGSEAKQRHSRSAAPFPQLPLGYDQHCFSMGTEAYPAAAPVDTCAGSDVGDARPQALISVLTVLMTQMVRPCIMCAVMLLELWVVAVELWQQWHPHASQSPASHIAQGRWVDAHREGCPNRRTDCWSPLWSLERA